VAALQLSTDDFQRLVGLLKRADAFQTLRDRQSFLHAALAEHHDGARLVSTLGLNGAAAVVAEGVVRDLEQARSGSRWAIAEIAQELLAHTTPEPSDRSFLMRLASRGVEQASGDLPDMRAFAPQAAEQVVDFATIGSTLASARPRLFIVHSHGSPDDDATVRGFADALRDDFEVVVDFDRTLVDRGWYRWSGTEYTRADFVLIAATREWCRRFNEFFTAGDLGRYQFGHGVRFEAGLITTELGRGVTRRVILVFFNDDDTRYAHLILGSLNQFVWPRDQELLTNALRSTVPADEQRARDSAATTDAPLTFRPPDRPASTDAPSRLPIVIALEQSDDPLADNVLFGMERHMIVTLAPEQVQALQDVTIGLRDRVTSVDEIADIGRAAWRILTDAQPRLRGLLERAAEEGALQPIAWTGFTDLLVRVCDAIAVANVSPESDLSSFLTLECGAHYFSPLTHTPGERTINPRLPSKPSLPNAPSAARGRPLRVATVLSPLDDLTGSLEVGTLRTAEVAMLSTPSVAAGLRTLATAFEAPQDGAAAARVVFAFGEGAVDAAAIDRVVAQAPSISIGGAALGGREMTKALEASLTALAGRQAVPCIVAGLRRAWVTQAADGDLVPAIIDGLLWTTWSWMGRPLFSPDFGQPPPPAYPHLMDLRSIVSTGWYHDRTEGVPEPYQAAELVRRDLKPAERFHLYLSGAGGTGKSCFLHAVYKRLLDRDDVLAVWYRVDAPSSEWKDVAARLKQECAAALQRKLGAERVSFDRRALELSDFLVELLKASRSSSWGITEVVIFLDQLERTFESGDEPEFERLKNIATKVMTLLSAVGVGQGVRLFLASRKQYLPDFLHSWQHALKSGLHFNVLQAITEASDQRSFVADVQKWCLDEQLVDESVRIDSDAAHELARKVGGHPLNMMLAMIQLLSENRTGKVTLAVLEDSRPWERLFGFDERVMAKSDLDWYLILAMAHARTEIVRFEEIWWRLRLVSGELSKQVDGLGKTRFVERLWLLGHLGRTIHARPHDGESFGFLEFFHANLRDYLVRDVMGYAGIDARFSRRRGGTPAAWRALDRLWAAAHEWEQIPQTLTAEDVRSLMEHRAVVIERPPTGDDDVAAEPFALLFLRDSRELRARLCQAARECFVLSALLHDDFGRWAFDAIFPDIEARVDCCRRWMHRCGQEARARIIQYLIQADGHTPRHYLVQLVLGDPERTAAGWRDVATQLSEPLMAARYRTDVSVSVLEALGAEGLGREASRRRFHEFAALACSDDRNELVNLLASSAHRLNGSPRSDVRYLGAEILSGKYVELDVEREHTPAIAPVRAVREQIGRAPAKLQVVAGVGLTAFVTHGRIEAWRRRLSDDIGIPLPAMELARGEVDPTELELRINGQRVADGDFHPSRRQILKRHWDERHAFAPTDAVSVHDDTRGEVVLWLDEAYLAQIGWNGLGMPVEDAVVAWLGEELRRHANAVIDLDVVSEFMKDVEVTADVSRVFRRFSLHHLVRLVRNLARERVPFGSPAGRLVLLQALNDVAGEGVEMEIVLQKVREHFRAEICKVHTDRSAGRLFVLLLEPELEERLAASVTSSALRLSPATAESLASAVRRQVELTLNDHDAMPVVVCPDVLRLPLFRLLERFDPRIAVLSTSEILPDVAWVNVGRLGANLVARVASSA
jgi:hypothetical protein